MKDKAQVSLEYIIVLGIAFVVLIVVVTVIHMMMSTGKIIVDINSAEVAAESLRDGADNIYVLGHPAKTRKNIFIPEGVIRVDIAERMILLRLEIGTAISSSYTDVYEVTRGNVTGNICPGGCVDGNYVVVFNSIAPGGRDDVNITLAD